MSAQAQIASGYTAAAPAGVDAVGDLSPFRSIAEDTLRSLAKGDLIAGRTRINDLEAAWDQAEDNLRPRAPERWRTIDKALDAALAQLRTDKPQAAAATEALTRLISVLGPASSGGERETPRGASGAAAARELPPVTVSGAVAVAQSREEGAAVLDVSFEPEGGRPMYQVRTYKDGRVWDGVIDATTGAIVGPGTKTPESTLDDEDKAEVAALRSGKIGLSEALANAERHAGGRALTAGLEQVDGRVVWEILVQNGAENAKLQVDPNSGQVTSASRDR
jgi:uncharacterized membrane protein YkoI